MRQIVLDTETTGLEPAEGHRLIEIGAVELINRRLTGKHFHRYLNPQRDIDAGAQQVHGITLEFLADKPLFSEIVQEFLDFIRDAEIIIHNAKFDTGFLNHELQLLDSQLGNVEQYCRITDSLLLARDRHPGQRNSLDALCKRYNIDNSHRDLHGALLDAQLLAQVYLAMTGGQGALFQETASRNSTTGERAAHQVSPLVSQAPLSIIFATTEELAAHVNCLQEIEKRSNNCLWLKQKNEEAS